MNRKLSLLLLVVIGLTLSACASSKKEQVSTGATGASGANSDDSSSLLGDEANAFNTGYSKSALEALGIIGDPLNYRTLYFAYNSTAIDERSSIIASAHARYLADNSATVTLEGHADEQGTRDYNLSLGERRANSVSDLMNAIDVGSSSLSTISYGEERPVEVGHSESAWQKNRRVEVIY